MRSTIYYKENQRKTDSNDDLLADIDLYHRFVYDRLRYGGIGEPRKFDSPTGAFGIQKEKRF